MSEEYEKAIIRIEVPKHQIGQEVSCYFTDTMCAKAVCEKEKVGHWVEVIDCETTLDGNPCTLSHYECSECKNINSDLGKYKYCPNCGARMESEE